MKHTRRLLFVAAALLSSASALPLTANAQPQASPEILNAVNSAVGLPQALQEQFIADAQQIRNAQSSGNQEQVANAQQIYLTHLGAAFAMGDNALLNAQAQLALNPSDPGVLGQVASAQTIVDGVTAANAAIQALGLTA
jgi:hypothetical protein